MACRARARSAPPSPPEPRADESGGDEPRATDGDHEEPAADASEGEPRVEEVREESDSDRNDEAGPVATRVREIEAHASGNAESGSVAIEAPPRLAQGTVWDRLSRPMDEEEERLWTAWDEVGKSQTEQVIAIDEDRERLLEDEENEKSETPENAALWKRWFNFLKAEMWLVFVPGAILGILLPGMLISHLAKETGTAPSRETMPTYAADQLRATGEGDFFFYLALIIGFLVLFSTQMVVFEMLTGQRVFQGRSASDMIAQLLTAEIDWTRLPSGVPPAVRYLLERCLERGAVFGALLALERHRTEHDAVELRRQLWAQR